MMKENVKRIAQGMCYDFDNELAQKTNQLETIEAELAEIVEKIKLLCIPTFDEAMKLRQEGLSSSDTFGIVDEKLRTEYKKYILDPLRGREVYLKSELARLQGEIPSIQKALDRIIGVVGKMNYVVFKLGKAGLSKKRITDAWDKIAIKEDVEESDFVKELLDQLLEDSPRACNMEIGKEFDRLKEEGWFE